MDVKKIAILLVLIVAAAAGITYYFINTSNNGGLVASGTIEGTEITVSSKIVGRAVEVRVDEGDNVTAGDVIAVLEAKELKEALKSAQAGLKMARDDYLRSKKLYRDKMISPQQFEASSSSLDMASAAYETAKLQYENAVVKAPISGVVLVKAIDVGELAVIGTPIATLADLSSVNLRVYLAERDVGKVNLGEEVDVSVDSYPGEKFTGKVRYISDKAEFTPKSIQTKAERTTQVFGIKIEINNPELKLKPGMPADAEFKWNSH